MPWPSSKTISDEDDGGEDDYEDEGEDGDLEEGSGETREAGNICLAGKVLGSKPFNASVVHNILTHAWKTRASFTVVPWNNNVFLFRFEDIEDRNSVLQEGPWSIMNNLLVLKPIQDGMGVAEIDFSRCPFWIQIHGLPIEKMTRANAEIIGNRFDKLLAFETSPDNILLARNFLRIRAEINTTLPIPKGFWLRRKTPENSELWISYKYEKLQDYCYSCGRLGHENKTCRFVPRVDGLNPSYCQDLRTGRAKRAAIPIEIIRQEVDDAEKRVEALLARRPVIRSRENDARAVEGGSGRVETPVVDLNQRTLEEVGVPQSSIRTFASKRDAPGVALSSTVEITPPSSPRDSANKGSPKSLVPFLTPNNPPSTTTLSIPEKSSSPQHPDIPLTSVFRSLAIKRRASDDLEEQVTPKILRLCSSGVDPIIPKHKPSRPTRATSKVRRKPLSLSKGCNYDDNSMVMDNGLCEVQIQQDFVNYDNAGSGVSKAVEAEGNSSIMLANMQGNGNGHVAGPKQPHPQC
ncbi:hypothetical protein RHGRI_025115 [Rhododendron griersonianum]|uniref:CCHC-type domain-containing protein n=1 Tax=Rhododendron griersonianum TaxID=479676 RepID=A0AAV6JEA1_9ERIC|nr:hypothetical protein RHGRI_025115 [Rhododendron griersonianum]